MTIGNRVLRPAILVLLSLVLIGALGWRVVAGAIEESYSPGWYAASTENARYRGVFVKSVAVRPSTIVLNDSVAFAVTDAWVERPTRVRYRWFLFRQETKDTTFRVVLHLAQLARDTSLWTYARGRSFVAADILIDGKDPARSGDASVHTIYLPSARPFRDTLQLTVRH